MIVAITGRSGCGKTEVANYFSGKGYTVIDADKVANMVLQNDENVQKKLLKEFGKDILDENGEISRKSLANFVFLEKESTKLLTDITHPAIVENILKIAQGEEDKLIFVDGAVIVNELFEKHCDKIIVITARNADAVSRIVLRDGISYIAAQNRINTQCDESLLREKADFIIENTGGKQQLISQAEKVLASVKEIFDAKSNVI